MPATPEPSRHPVNAECDTVAVVINPVSGGAGAGPVVRGILDRVRRAGYTPISYRTEGPNDVARFLRGLPCRPRAVLACGGDGTIREVVEALIDDPIPVLPVPTGTENIVAKDFRIRQIGRASCRERV